MPPDESDQADDTGEGATEDTRDEWTVHEGEELVVVDETGTEWTLPTEDDDWVLLDDSGDEWVLVDETGTERVTLEESDDEWVLVDETGTTRVTGEGSPDADGDRELSRRGALQLAAGGVVAASLLGVGASTPEDPDPKGVSIEDGLDGVDFDYPTALDLPFAHGVASGDPLPTRVILWTRLTYEEPPERRFVDYEVGTDPALSEVVTEGTVVTGPARDWTVKADATGLEPGTTYYYRFHTEEATSIVGRTRTAPVGAVSELRFGVVACSSYWSGQFNAYGRLADRNSLDLVIHLGDHVYPGPPGVNEQRRARLDIFDDEYVDARDWRNLAEVRRRYALYYSDPDLLRAHQQHPFSIVWDDGDLKEPEDESATRAETRQAFWEWTPTRPAKPDGSGEPIPPTEGYVEPEDDRYLYRRLPYGNLADVLMMDQQQWRTPTAEDRSAMFDADRTMLGDEQFEWLTDAMVASHESGTPWRVLGNQKFIAPFRAKELPRTVPLFDRDEVQGDLTYNPAQWDGYVAERERLCEHLREHGVDDNIFVTGDMHMNWCADVTDDPTQAVYDGQTGTGRKRSVGVEYAPTSVTRGGADEVVEDEIWDYFSPEMARDVAVALTRFASNEIDATNPHVEYIEWVEHGYGIAHLTPDEARLEYWWTPLLPRTPQQEFGAQVRVPQTDTTDELHNHGVRVANPDPTTGSRTAQPAPVPDGLDAY